MIARAAGACSPRWWTCAITSCLSWRSSSAARLRSKSSRCARIASTASSGIGSPSSRSASASASQSLRQVPNLNCAENRYDISGDAYRSVRGLEYRSDAISDVQAGREPKPDAGRNLSALVRRVGNPALERHEVRLRGLPRAVWCRRELQRTRSRSYPMAADPRGGFEALRQVQLPRDAEAVVDPGELA